MEADDGEIFVRFVLFSVGYFYHKPDIPDISIDGRNVREASVCRKKVRIYAAEKTAGYAD